MGNNLKRQRTLHLLALAGVFLLRPFLAFADEGLPNPPNVKSGVEGSIEKVTIQGRTFLSGRQVVSISAGDYVSVDVEIFSPDGAGSRVNLQRYMKIEYRWIMLPDGQDRQLTETINVKSTFSNLDTGKITTERNDDYKVETKWISAGTAYALERCQATSDWVSEGGPVGNFHKVVSYSNEASVDGRSWIRQQVISADTTFVNTDPVWGGWSYSRSTEWNNNTGSVTKHTVSINGVNQPNPFGAAMVERAVVGRGMDTGINDPSVPPLSGVPFAWPGPPRIA